MNDRNCENCVYARPYGGENDNRCTAWECEFIDREEAIEVYKNQINIGDILQDAVNIQILVNRLVDKLNKI